MAKDTYLEKKLKEFKSRLNRNIPVKKMIFFGSRAIGKPHKYSDIDLIIVSDKFKGKISYERSLGFYKYWDIDYPVDFLCYTPEEFKKLSRQITIVRDAVRKGIVI